VRGVFARINDLRTLIVADTHVGYEVELWQKGIRAFPQTKVLINELTSWASEVGAEQLAIVGDVKHEIPRARSTLAEVKEFLEAVSENFEHVLLIPGNHDALIDKVLEKLSVNNVTLAESRGLLVKSEGRNLLLVHGHVKPRLEHLVSADVVVMGHTHPAVTLRDKLGYTVREPAVLRARISLAKFVERMYGVGVEDREITLVILPASHPLIIGVDVVSALKPRESRTILTYAELNPAKIEVYLTDFTYLGTLDEYVKTSGAGLAVEESL